ncbi:MAG: hypothetical protein WDL87_03665 [Candidatus Omnitrophota bacterium]|jgi:hypothetical protein
MRKTTLGVWLGIFLSFCVSTHVFAGEKKQSMILLISEQNIEGPQRAWWASEIDLSTTEARIIAKLTVQGYDILEPALLAETIKKEPAFRQVNLSEQESIKLGNLSHADYVIVGKAVASAGGVVPQSTMRSCFANLTAKLINVKEGKIVAYLEASGNSVHLDVITGGKEALANAADDLAQKLLEALKK